MFYLETCFHLFNFCDFLANEATFLAKENNVDKFVTCLNASSKT